MGTQEVEEGERGQERKKEDKVRRESEEEGDKQVKKDVMDWVEVRRRTRGKSRKMVQIFVKVNGSKATPIEVNLTDDKVEDIMRQVQKDEDAYVTMQGKVLKTSKRLKSCGVTDGCTIQVTSRMRGGGKHREKQSKIEKERSGSPKKIEQAQGQKAVVEPSLNVDEMYVLMEEQMRSLSRQAKSLQVTNEDMQRIVGQVVRMRLMAENMKKQASDDGLQRVEKMEQGLKVFVEEVRTRQKELETRETKEQNVTMSPEDEVGRKATRECRGCAGLVQGEDETHRMNETCGKGKGKGNGGKGEHGGKGDKEGKGFQQNVKMLKSEVEQEADEEEERVQVAPNMGTDNSYPQTILNPKKNKKKRNMKAEISGL